METAVEHKFDISKGNFVIRRMISFSYFLANQQLSLLQPREKAIPCLPHPHRTHTNEVYYVLLLRCMQKYCNAMENLSNLLK